MHFYSLMDGHKKSMLLLPVMPSVSVSVLPYFTLIRHRVAQRYCWRRSFRAVPSGAFQGFHRGVKKIVRALLRSLRQPRAFGWLQRLVIIPKFQSRNFFKDGLFDRSRCVHRLHLIKSRIWRSNLTRLSVIFGVSPRCIQCHVFDMRRDAPKIYAIFKSKFRNHEVCKGGEIPGADRTRADRSPLRPFRPTV